jgi:hypothetical protein
MTLAYLELLARSRDGLTLGCLDLVRGRGIAKLGFEKVS